MPNIFEPNFGAYTDWKSMLREIVTGQIPGLFTSSNLVSTGIRGQLRMTYYPAVATTSAANVLALTAQPAAGTTTVTAGITQPDVPRIIRIVSNQVTGTGNLVVNGTDINGTVISDTLAVNGTTPVNGVKAFKTVTSVVIPTRGASGDQVSLGGGAALGLQDTLFTNTVLATYVNLVQDTTPATVTFSSTVLSQNTAASATAYAAHAVLFLYVAESAS